MVRSLFKFKMEIISAFLINFFFSPIALVDKNNLIWLETRLVEQMLAMYKKPKDLFNFLTRIQWNYLATMNSNHLTITFSPHEIPTSFSSGLTDSNDQLEFVHTISIQEMLSVRLPYRQVEAKTTLIRTFAEIKSLMEKLDVWHKSILYHHSNLFVKIDYRKGKYY